MNEPDFPHARLLEFVSTVLMSLAVILSAWSGYQSSRWSGEQAVAFSEANAARVDSTRAATHAGQLTQIDVASFLSWSAAYSEGDKTLEGFLYDRFRAPMKKAVEEWIALKPLKNADAPPTPFAMDSYVLPEQEEADRLLDRAAERGTVARQDNQRSDNYVLAVVLFASVLFFSGIATKLSSERSQILLLGLGSVVLIGTALWVATFPVSFGI